MSNHSQAKKAALGNPQVVEKDRLGWPVDRRGYTSKMSDNALITSYFLLLNLRASLPSKADIFIDGVSMANRLWVG